MVAAELAPRTVLLQGWLWRWIFHLWRHTGKLYGHAWQRVLLMSMLVAGTSWFWTSEVGQILSPASLLPLQSSFTSLDFMYHWRKGEKWAFPANLLNCSSCWDQSLNLQSEQCTQSIQLYWNTLACIIDYVDLWNKALGNWLHRHLLCTHMKAGVLALGAGGIL